MDANRINRSVYNFLTLLGDVGGFFGIVSAFFAFINSATSYQRAENLFVQTLYDAKPLSLNGKRKSESTDLIAKS